MNYAIGSRQPRAHLTIGGVAELDPVMAVDKGTIFTICMVAVAAYPAILWAAARAVSNTRVRLASLGREMLADDQCSEWLRVKISDALAHATDPWSLASDFIDVPVYMGRDLFCAPREKNTFQAGKKEKILEFAFAFTRSQAAANPLLYIALLVEIAVVGLICLVIGAFLSLFREVTLPRFDTIASLLHSGHRIRHS